MMVAVKNVVPKLLWYGDRVKKKNPMVASLDGWYSGNNQDISKDRAE